MTTLIQIRERFEQIAKKAKENHQLFQKAVPKSPDDPGTSQITFLNRLQSIDERFKTARAYLLLERAVVDPEKDIETFLNSLPEGNTEEQDKKIEAKIALKQLMQQIRELNNQLNRTIVHLSDNMVLMTPQQHKEHQATVKLRQDTEKYTELVTAISKEQLPHAPEHKKNRALNQAYEQMKLAFEQMKQLGSGNKALEVGRNHETAVYLLERNIQQYKQYEKAYQGILIAQQQTEENIREATLESEQLVRKYKEVIAKFPAGAPVLELPKKDAVVIDKDVSYLDGRQLIYANILKDNEDVRTITEQMEVKYSTDVKTAQEGIVKKAQEIGSKLTEMNRVLSLHKDDLPQQLREKLNERYEKIQSRNNEILQTSAGSDELHVLKNKDQEITDLAKNASKLEQDISAQISRNMVNKYNEASGQIAKRIAELKKEIKPEDYPEFYSSLNDLHLPALPERLSISDLAERFNDLKEFREQVDRINLSYQNTKTSVKLILDGFKKGKGTEFLQTALGSINDSDTQVSRVLHFAAQQSSPRQITNVLAHIKFGELTPSQAQGVEDFIKKNANLRDMAQPMRAEDVALINEKLKCYKLVEPLVNKEQYLPLVDNKQFRQALSFLHSLEIPANDAVALINTPEKRNLVLLLKEHCSTLTTDELKGVLSSPTKVEAAAAIFDKMSLPQAYEEFQGLSTEDKNALYSSLMREIAANEEFAKAAIKIQENPQLFNAVSLLSLAKFDDRIHDYDATKNFIIEKLNSDESEHYQKVIGIFMQAQRIPAMERYFDLTKTKADILITKFKPLLSPSATPIKKVAAVFEHVETLFTSIAQEEQNANLINKLQATKTEIFSEFIQNHQWDKAVDKSVEIINDKLKDERSVLQKVLDGFSKAIEKISNWWNNIETPKEPVEAKEISTRFKAAMVQIRGDEPSVSDNLQIKM